MGMTGRLNTRVALWGMVENENEIGEMERTETKIKDMWVEVKASVGGTKPFAGTNVEEMETTQLVRCRIQEIKIPSIDMFFVDKRGWKYEFVSFIPSYKERNFWDIKTRISYE